MNATNTTIATGPRQEFHSCLTAWGVGIATLSSLSLLINIFHLVIICRMKALKDRPYKLILIHITLGDIGTALTLIMVYSCLPMLPLISRLTGFPLMGFIVSWPLYMTHWIFVAASAEQYYSICRPFQYEKSIFVKKLSLILISTWIITFCYMVSVAGLTWYMQTKAPHAKLAAQIAVYMSRYMPMILATVFFTLTIRELRKMRQTEMADGQVRVYYAAAYVIIIYSIFSESALLDLVFTPSVIARPALIPFSPE